MKKLFCIPTLRVFLIWKVGNKRCSVMDFIHAMLQLQLRFGMEVCRGGNTDSLKNTK